MVYKQLTCSIVRSCNNNIQIYRSLYNVYDNRIYYTGYMYTIILLEYRTNRDFISMKICAVYIIISTRGVVGIPGTQREFLRFTHEIF